MSLRRPSPPSPCHGFTLIEMAIVIFIIGLMLAGLIGPVQIQLEARDRHKTKTLMDQAADALYGYALTNRRLPCPDYNGDGMPDPAFDPASKPSATCGLGAGSGDGFLPWAELGVDPADAWGNRLTYRVRYPEFTWPAQDTACNGNNVDEFDLCATGDIVINTRGDNATTAAIEGKFAFAAATADNIAAVLVSHGRNGYGAHSSEGQARAPVPSSNVDEEENANNDGIFVSRNYSREQSGCADDTSESSPLCEFDDLLVPISRTILNSRMVAAGQLP